MEIKFSITTVSRRLMSCCSGRQRESLEVARREEPLPLMFQHLPKVPMVVSQMKMQIRSDHH